MKPCYIRGKKGMRINLDGPALSISAPGKAAVLAPLRRISRIVIYGLPEYSTPALLACAERGICVTFLQEDGTVKAHLHGQSRPNHNLAIHLRGLLDLPDWQERYCAWLDTSARLVLQPLCRALNLLAEQRSLTQIRAALNHRLEQVASADQRLHLQRRLQGLCNNLASTVLQKAGLNAEYSRHIEQRLNLPADFSNLLSLSLQLPVARGLGCKRQWTHISNREFVALFERHSERLERMAWDLTNHLHNFLMECA